MIKFFSFLFLCFFLCVSLSAQPIQNEQDTEKVLADNAHTAEAADTGNPSDMVTGDAIVPETGTFTRISKHQDYGLTVTRLVVDLGEGSAITIKDLPEGSFEVLGVNKSEKVIRTIKGLSVTDNKGDSVASGRYVTIDLDVGFDSDADNAYTCIVTLDIDLGKYTKGAIFVQKGRTLRK